MGTISVTGIAIVHFYHDHRAFPITPGINVPFGHFDLLAQTISVIGQAKSGFLASLRNWIFVAVVEFQYHGSFRTYLHRVWLRLQPPAADFKICIDSQLAVCPRRHQGAPVPYDFGIIENEEMVPVQDCR